MGGGAQPWEPVRLPARRHDRRAAGPRERTRQRLLPRRCVGVREDVRRRRGADRGKRVLLEFEGVYRGASVWVNGTLVGPPPVRLLELHRVDRRAPPVRRRERRSRSTPPRTRTPGGTPALGSTGRSPVVGEPVHVALDAVHVTTPTVDDDGAVIAVATIVENDSLVTTVTTGDDRGRSTTTGTVVARDVAPLTVFPGGDRDAAPAPVRGAASAVERRPAPPVLVPHDGRSATVTTIDEAATEFGIRTIAVDAERGLRINGEPVELRGACIHHDNGVIGSRDDRPRRRATGRDAQGSGLQRAAQRPPSDERRDARGVRPPRHAGDGRDVRHVDRAEERRRLRARAFPDWWEADVDAMVRKDRNHPSVIMYSIGNEIPDTGNSSGARDGARHLRAHPRPRRHPDRDQLDQPHARRAGRRCSRRSATGPVRHRPTGSWASTR